MYTDSFQRFLEKESLNEKQNIHICPFDASTEDRQSAKPFIYILYTVGYFFGEKKKDSKLHTGKPKNPFFPRKMYDKAEKECGTAAVL